jgi:putative ABC transport system permease protein
VNQFSVREQLPSILVATLSAAFGVTLLQVVAAMALTINNDPVTGGSQHTVPLLLNVIALIFIAIAVYVGAVVTANTFSTIIAGRTRTIALLRLIGSSAVAQRRSVAREGLLVGVIGAVVGAGLGTGITALLLAIAVRASILPNLAYGYWAPQLLLPIVAVVLTTWLASWIGSRRVLTVTPMQAIGASQELSRDETTARRGRNGVAITLFVLGVGLLILGVVVGFISPLGVFIGLVGGIISFSGLVLGAHLVMPPALRLVGHLFGRSASARLAAENAVRYPERSSRTTIGLVIGVTLVTMFSVAIGGYQQMLNIAQANQPETYQGIGPELAITVAVFSILTGFSALIAAVGMVNNLSMSVLQRTRELGLLRALGFTAQQVRRMILVESAQLTTAAVLVGLVLGTFYGWAGAQSLLGSYDGTADIVVPVFPWLVIGIIVVAAVILTLVATVTPARRATRVTPVAALAVD